MEKKKDLNSLQLGDDISHLEPTQKIRIIVTLSNQLDICLIIRIEAFLIISNFASLFQAIKILGEFFLCPSLQTLF